MKGERSSIRLNYGLSGFHKVGKHIMLEQVTSRDDGKGNQREHRV